MTRFLVSRPFQIVLALTLVIAAPAAGAEIVEPQQPTNASRCPVCGMLVARHIDWLAQIVLDGGNVLFFDGAKDLFRYSRDPERFQDAPAMSDDAAMFVTSYYDGKSIPAGDALYVVGSDVLGPMGAELIPHPSQEAAEEFMRDHTGTKILRYEEVTTEILAALH